MTESKRTYAAPAGMVATTAALLLLAGCGQVESVAPTTQPITDPAKLYVRLALNQSGINLTTDPTMPAYSTFQLTATPYDGAGNPIADAPTPTFTSLDTSTVTVTPSGLLRGLQAGNQVRIVAELTLDDVRHADTAVVSVQDLASPPVLDTLSIHVPPESAVRYVRLQTESFNTALVAQFTGLLLPPRPIPKRTVDAAGNPISGLEIDYTSLDPTVASIDRHDGTLNPISRGYARIVARTVAYGVVKADTMTYTIQPPLVADIGIKRQGFNIHSGVYPPVLTLTVVTGGIVGWFSTVGAPTEIIFDDPTNVAEPPGVFCGLATGFIGPEACGSGNIPAFFGDSLTGLDANGAFAGRWRGFPVAGTYPYHSTTGGAGKIVVVDRVALP